MSRKSRTILLAFLGFVASNAVAYVFASFFVPEFVDWAMANHPVAFAMFTGASILFGGAVGAFVASSGNGVDALKEENERLAKENAGLSRDNAVLQVKYDHLLFLNGSGSGSGAAAQEGVSDDATAVEFINALFDEDIDLSPNAKNAWSRTDAAERASFRRVCAASAFDSSGGHAVTPLILEAGRTLSEIGLDEGEIETLIEIGLVKEAEKGRRLYIAREIDGGFVADGVTCDGDGVTFQLSNGTFKTGLVSGRATCGSHVSQWADCVDLGVIEFTSAGREVAAKLDVESSSGIYEYLKSHHQGRKQAVDFSKAKKRD